MRMIKLLLVMLFSIAVAACGGGGGGGGGSTVQVYTGISLTGVSANGITLGGRLIAPVTVGSHTYYYWDASGDGTSSSADTVTHDQLDQIFNGGTLGDNTKDTTDATVNTVTLSNGVRIHLPTIAELSALYALTGWTHTGWSGLFWSASQVSSGASPAGPGAHSVIMDSNGGFINAVDTQTLNVVFEVLGATSANISATAITTAQNLTVNTAMTSFSPLIASGGASPYTYSHTGTLPTGLSFSTSTGAVTGTPTATYATANLVFSVKDANNVVASTTSTVSFTVGTAATAPTAPTGISATAGDSVATVSWNAVVGADSYNIYMAWVSGVTKSNYSSLAGGLKFSGMISPQSFQSMTNGKTVYIVVTAVNAYGESSESSQVSAIPYLVQGGLTWMPVTSTGTWTNANVYCTNTTINGQTGWRLPTQSELSALYASGALNGQGWTLDITWSSTPVSAGSHYIVYLYDGSVIAYNDTGYGGGTYVTCVH